MSGFIKAALCAAVLTCAGEAHAARYLYTLEAVGTGTYATGSRSGTPSVADVKSVTISFVAYYTTNAMISVANRVAVIPATNGLFISDSDSPPGLTAFDGYGLACFANPTAMLPVASVTVDSGCSFLSFFSINTNERLDFTGTFTSLSVSETDAELSFRITPFVPEPSTWALMLAGFGLTGYALRRRAKAAFA